MSNNCSRILKLNFIIVFLLNFSFYGNAFSNPGIGTLYAIVKEVDDVISSDRLESKIDSALSSILNLESSIEDASQKISKNHEAIIKLIPTRNLSKAISLIRLHSRVINCDKEKDPCQLRYELWRNDFLQFRLEISSFEKHYTNGLALIALYNSNIDESLMNRSEIINIFKEYVSIDGVLVDNIKNIHLQQAAMSIEFFKSLDFKVINNPEKLSKIIPLVSSINGPAHLSFKDIYRPETQKWNNELRYILFCGSDQSHYDSFFPHPGNAMSYSWHFRGIEVSFKEGDKEFNQIRIEINKIEDEFVPDKVKNQYWWGTGTGVKRKFKCSIPYPTQKIFGQYRFWSGLYSASDNQINYNKVIKSASIYELNINFSVFSVSAIDSMIKNMNEIIHQ